MNLNQNQTLAAAAAAGAGAWHIVRPIAQPYIDRVISAVPAYLAGRARDKFAAAIASGRIPAPAVRLLKKLGAAAIQWANEEAGAAPDDAAAAASIVAAASHLPGVGPLVAADQEDAAHDLTVAIAALRAQLAAETKT